MMNLFEMLQAIFGKNIMSRTIGTRTNVIKFPSNKNNPTTTSFDVFRASENPAVIEKLKKIIADEAPYIAKMNDSERTIYEGNVRRLHDHLVSTGEVKPAVSAEVIGLGDKQPVTGKGLESLTEQAGQVSAPGTMVGNIESRINKLKQLSQEMEKATGEKAGVGDILKQFGTEQGSMSRMQDEGLVRAAGRQILINDIKAGKIKNLNASEVLNMKEPLDPFRQIYGEGALEQLDSLIPEFRSLRTEMDAEKLARSKFKFEPNENRLPGSVSIEEGKKAEQEFGINSPKGLDYLTGGEPNKKPKVSDFKAEATKRKSIDELIDEYNANQDRLRLTDEEGGTKIGYEEFKNLQDRNREIEKALELKGISSEVEPKPEAEIIPFNKKPPEGKAEGGRIGYADGTPMSGLVYVNSWEGPWTGPEFLGGPTKGQYYNKRNILTPVNTEVAPVVTSSSYNLNPNASLKDQYLNRLAALQSSSLSSSSYQNFKNLLQSKLEGKAEGGRIGYQTGGPTNRFLKYMIDMLVKEKDFNRGLLERSKPELVEGLFKQTYGKSAEEIANTVNQQLKGKSSMEVMNPKTGEITSPKKPVMTVEDLKNKHKDAFNAHDQIRVDIGDKIAPDMIAESMAEMKGKNYDNLSQKEQLGFYKKALAYVDDVRMTKRQNKMSVSNEMKQAMQEGVQKTNKMIELGLDPSNSKDYDKFLEMQSIQQKYGNMIDDNLLKQIMVDDNPQRKAEVMATIDEAMKMQEKGMKPDEILDIMKNTTRTKQARGGSVGLGYLTGE